MIMSCSWFNNQGLPENVNAPLVVYLYDAKGMTPEQIVEELGRDASHYAQEAQKYAQVGNEKKKSESEKFLAITKTTKQYIEDGGYEAIQSMVNKADSQLEKMCAKEGGFSEDEEIPEIDLNEDFDYADD